MVRYLLVLNTLLIALPGFAQDRDADTISDADEEGSDTDMDGTDDADDLDSDDDGLADSDEAGDADLATPPIDSDGDGTPDFRDEDSDNDGVFDADESLADLDNDGLADARDPDRDGDGFLDGVDVCPDLELRDQSDLDGDGEGDACEDDLDGDMVVDENDNCPLIANSDQLDRDGDGTGDACEILDEDGDGFDDRFGTAGGCAATPSGSLPGFLGTFLVLLLLSLRRRSVLLLISLLVVTSSAAEAQEPDTFSGERFRLATDRDGIGGVEAGSVPGHLDVQGVAWLSYADDPLVLRGDLDGGRVEHALIEDRIGAGIGLTVPFFERFAVSLQLPFVLHQSRPSDGEGFRFPLEDLSGGLSDLRVVPKVQLLDEADYGIDLAFMPAFTVNLGDGENYLREDDWTFRPELAASGGAGEFRMAANFAYHLRGSTRGVNLEVDDEIFARIGMALRFSEDGGVPVEVGAAVSLGFDVSDPFSDKNQVSTEFQGIFTWDAHEFFSVFGLVGAGMSSGWGTPDWRASIGVRAGVIRGEHDPCEGEEEDMDGFEDDDGCPDLDNDEDGVLDEYDDCALDAEDMDGFEDDDGCPETDNDEDGIEDEADRCPLEAETANGFEDEDGCPDDVPDADGDGVLGDADGCPNEAEDMDQVADADGCPEIDADGDGVLDEVDQCAERPGPIANLGCADEDQDGDGIVDRLDACPIVAGNAEFGGCAEERAIRIEESRIVITEQVFFRSGRSDIQTRSHAILDAVADVLRSHPNILHVRVEGHTDDRGREDANMRLSQARAEAVVAYLVEKGIETSRLRAVGYGESRPLREGRTSDARAANRRVAFVFEEEEAEAAVAD